MAKIPLKPKKKKKKIIKIEQQIEPKPIPVIKIIDNENFNIIIDNTITNINGKIKHKTTKTKNMFKTELSIKISKERYPQGPILLYTFFEIENNRTEKEIIKTIKKSSKRLLGIADYYITIKKNEGKKCLKKT